MNRREFLQAFGAAAAVAYSLPVTSQDDQTITLGVAGGPGTILWRHHIVLPAERQRWAEAFEAADQRLRVDAQFGALRVVGRRFVGLAFNPHERTTHVPVWVSLVPA